MENAVNIHPELIKNKSCLQFHFVGYLSDEIALSAIENWKGHMQGQSASKICLIYNCNDMKGFDTNARKNWQAAMGSFKNQIDEIWVVCDNLFIMTAAKTMGLLTGLPIKVCRTLDAVVQ